jgi:hypothetical protein
MGIAPVPATRKLLERLGLSLGDMANRPANLSGVDAVIEKPAQLTALKDAIEKLLARPAS